MKAEVFTKSDCGYCVKAKSLLKSKGIEYNEFIISAGLGEKPLLENQSYVTKQHLLERYPAAKSVPQIWLDGQHIGGYDQLELFFKNLNAK
jgi:glutaredoxin 3